MKRIVLLLGVLCLLVIPALAVQPLTPEEMTSAIYDAETDRYFDGTYWYDSAGVPIEEAPAADIENTVSSADASGIDADSEPDSAADTEPTLIHAEDTGTTQVNVFAIQTEDETGGTWIQGGSGTSLVESLFGEYVPYNAAGIASVDWAWIADVVLFAILVICFFKIVAGVIKRV